MTNIFALKICMEIGQWELYDGLLLCLRRTVSVPHWSCGNLHFQPFWPNSSHAYLASC